MPAWAGLWNRVHGQNYASAGQRSSLSRNIDMAYAKQGTAVLGAIDTTLNGAAAGSTATKTRRVVQGLQSISGYALGGKRTVEQVTLVNRATTAGDKTALDALKDGFVHPQTAIADKSGMGGGSKAGRL